MENNNMDTREINLQNDITVLKEIKELDDSMYQYNPSYMGALDRVLEEVQKRVPEHPVIDYKFSDWMRERMHQIGGEHNLKMAEQKTYCCPDCKRSLHIIDKVPGAVFGDSYCKWCGKAISWIGVKPIGEEKEE